MTTDKETLEQTAERIVRQEVFYCVSALVSTLARGYGYVAAERVKDVADLTEQAMELASPIPDYESAAEEAGWVREAGGTWKRIAPNTTGTAAPELLDRVESAEEACESDNIEPYDREVYEHWIVSDWLADKLEARGEKVDRDFAGLTVWARTTTGQGIAMDSVIEDIAREVRGA